MLSLLKLSRFSSLPIIRSSPVLSSLFSTTSSSSQSKLYELRTYSIKPSKFGAFLQLSNEKLHLRTAHSKLVGYWTTELGGLNEVVHLWEYDNYAHRTSIRQKLGQDKEWVESYVSQAFPYIDKQDNVTLSLLPWTPLNEEPSPQPRAFELTCHSLLPGRVQQWEHQMRQGWAARLQYSTPVGFWRTQYGPLHNVYELWAYPSFDEREIIMRKTLEDEEWRDTIGHAILFTQSSWTKGLAPVNISPLK